MSACVSSPSIPPGCFTLPPQLHSRGPTSLPSVYLLMWHLTSQSPLLSPIAIAMTTWKAVASIYFILFTHAQTTPHPTPWGAPLRQVWYPAQGALSADNRAPQGAVRPCTPPSRLPRIYFIQPCATGWIPTRVRKAHV